MKVSYDDIRYFKAIIEALSRLVDEASFKIKPDGMELEAIDRAHISLIKINLPKDEFKEYDVQEDVNFGFSTQYLLKILSTSKRKEELEIESQDVSTIMLRINGEYPRVFELRNMEVSPPELPELKIEFDVNAIVKSDAFRKAIDEIATVSDVADIIADENGIKVKSKGEAEAEVELSKDSGSLQDIEISKSTESSYSTDYLNDILVLTKLSGSTKMSFAEQKPLQLEFNTESGGSVIYLLAPQLG
jgi:proliferating cell nuclear antigen